MHHDQDPAAQLADNWSQQLRRSGELRISYRTDHERDLYRRAGRQAGRLLNRPVRTHVAGQTVIVALADWMDRPLEHQLENARARNAINRAFDTADLPPADQQPTDQQPGHATITPLHGARPNDID